MYIVCITLGIAGDCARVFDPDRKRRGSDVYFDALDLLAGILLVYPFPEIRKRRKARPWAYRRGW